ncbi:hypothetical protein [Streptobacillus moniliformis]|uniref:hypothetical protein n=1 Tax=Streptobacillus moniliformis TaxID=34105 RepID=UPI0007E4BF24|nr:hypothetical protein [Streptobacillus moniliformis]
MKKYIMLLVLDKIYIKLDDVEYVFSYDEIFLDILDGLEELNVSSDAEIYVILGMEIIGLEKRVDNGILRKIRNIFSDTYMLKEVYTVFDIIEKNTIVLLKEFSIKISKNIEKIEFSLEDFEDGQDFSGYKLLKGNEELKDYIFSKDMNNVKKYNIIDTFFKIVPYSLLLIPLFIYVYFINVFDVKPLNSEISFLEEKIVDLKENEMKEMDFRESENTLLDFEGFKKMKKPFKKPFYMDIEFFLTSSKFGLSYTELLLFNDVWTIKGNVDNFKGLEDFEKSLKKYFGEYRVVELKDKNEGISFVYEITERKS